MDDKDKQVLFSDMIGFYNIKTNLETEISLFWVNNDLISAYNRIRMLYRHVKAHLKNKKTDETLGPKFKNIDRLIFNSANERMTQSAKLRKLRDFKEADNKIGRAHV